MPVEGCYKPSLAVVFSSFLEMINTTIDHLSPQLCAESYPRTLRTPCITALLGGEGEEWGGGGGGGPGLIVGALWGGCGQEAMISS